MRDGYEKNEAVRRRIGDWSAYGVGIGALLAAVQKAGVSYHMSLDDGEHAAWLDYGDSVDGWTKCTPTMKDRDAFTALRDALYQWVRATEEEA